MLFFNALEEGVIPSRHASFRPVMGRLGPKLGPATPDELKQQCHRSGAGGGSKIVELRPAISRPTHRGGAEKR